MGSKKSTQTTTMKLTKPLRRSAKAALGMVDAEFPAALEAARTLSLDASDPQFAGDVRDQYLATIRGDYTQSPYVDAQAERAANVAQRGIAGLQRNYGSGAYARAMLDARQSAALDVYGRERGYQFAALGMAPEQYDVATAPLRSRLGDVYRQRVSDPTRLATGYGAALGVNPLSQESKTKSKSKQPFDWGGFFGDIATSWLSRPDPGGGSTA